MAHMHYKGTGKVHSFRGLLEDGGQDKIGIQGPVGDRAWRINKMQLMGNIPGSDSVEHIVKVFREEQSSVTTTVTFDDNELLACAFLTQSSSAGYANLNVVFDNALFSRNIFVTHDDNGPSSKSVNYYIELEEVKVGKAGMAQLSLAASRRVQTDV